MGSVAEAGAARCTPCAKGWYQSSHGRTACEACPAGSYCRTHASEATPCLPGTYSPHGWLSKCTDCVAGEYQPSPNRTSCRPCEVGGWCPPAASEVVPCPAGTRRGELGGTLQLECEVCAAGLACLGPGEWRNTSFLECPPGSAAVETGSSACTACAPGTYQNLSGWDVCFACPLGHLCVGDTSEDGSGAVQPRECPGGTYGPEMGLPGAYGLRWEIASGPANEEGLRGDVYKLAKALGSGGARQAIKLDFGSTIPSVVGYSAATVVEGINAFKEPMGTFFRPLRAADACTPVAPGYWAPAGSVSPLPCDSDAVFCPGAALDTAYAGAQPHILEPGGQKRVVYRDEAGDFSSWQILATVTLEAGVDPDSAEQLYNATAVGVGLAALYGVPPDWVHVNASLRARHRYDVVLDTNLEEFTVPWCPPGPTCRTGRADFKGALAQYLGVPASEVTLSVSAGSVAVAASIYSYHRAGCPLPSCDGDETDHVTQQLLAIATPAAADALFIPATAGIADVINVSVTPPVLTGEVPLAVTVTPPAAALTLAKVRLADTSQRGRDGLLAASTAPPSPRPPPCRRARWASRRVCRRARPSPSPGTRCAPRWTPRTRARCSRRSAWRRTARWACATT